MKKALSLIVLASLLLFSGRSHAAGTWLTLTNHPPGPMGHFLLLSDGTVMGEDLSTNYGPGWFRLTPDIHGSYAHGTWTRTAPMHYTRLDFGSVVLRDGRLFVVGGEYGTGTNTAEIYDPVANSWTVAAAAPAVIGTKSFLDSNTVLLGNGKVLVTPVYPASTGVTGIYDPVANSWTTATLKHGNSEDEASSVMLPDGTILVVDFAATTSERFVPSSGQWINDATVPVSLYDVQGGELGPAVLLPNGKAIFFGGTTNTAIYTPSGSTALGTWVAGPPFPNRQGMPDAPAAVMMNGKVLCVVETASTTGQEWTAPLSFYEYDYVANSFTRIGAPGGGQTFNDVCWPTLLLDLPDGTVMFGHRQSDFYVYQPDGVPLAAGKPTLSSVTQNPDGSVHLTGKLFNGLSQGAAYGDDEQMDSNFPIVRFTDTSGTVRYGRTYNWSYIGVAQPNLVVSTDCTLPAGASLQDNIQVIANGISSGTDSVVQVADDNGPGSLRQLAATAPSGATITFASSLAGKTILLTNGPIGINGNLGIDGSGLAGGVAISGNRSSSVFTVNGGTLALTALTITNGVGSGLQNSGTLLMTNCTVTGNSSSGNGGGIYNGGSLILSGCTFATNTANFAGAIQNYGPCTMINCTIVGNNCTNNGGAIDNDFSGAVLALIHCTFAGNSASGLGGAVDNYQAITVVTNSILAGNSDNGGGGDVFNWAQSTVNLYGTNIVPAFGNNGTNLGNGTVLTSSPQLSPFANYGGLTKTMPPLFGSPAIDGAGKLGIVTDQRGLPRPIGPAPDIGAVEYLASPVVTSVLDNASGSLRDAVLHGTNGATLTFSGAVSNRPIVLTNGSIPVTRDVTIDGSAILAGVIISGNGASRILDQSGGTLTLRSLTLSNAYIASGFGAAIQALGNLVIDRCRIVNCRSDGTAGALAAAFGTLALTNSTIAGNLGGNVSGLYLQDELTTLVGCTISGNSGSDALRLNAAGSDSSLTLINCTLSGNTSGGGVGAAISLQGSIGKNANCGLTNCTVTGNSSAQAGAPGAIYLEASGVTNHLTLVNTIVAGNVSGGSASDITGTAVPSSSFNLIGVGGGLASGVNGNIVGVANPQLSTLATNGGTTMTMLPLIGSPAIDGGGDTLVASLVTDQAGNPRLAGAHVDIGAVELPVSPIVVTLADGPYGSLRYAATYLPAGSTITFAAGLASGTLLLTNGVIPLNANVTIDGSSLSSPVQLNGNHATPIFNIPAGINATLTALTLTNGYAGSGGSGGGIQNGGILVLKRCTLAGNSADTVGGAINNSGSLLMTSSTLFNNSASFAGAIQNYAECTLINCTLASNVCANNGGAIDNDYGATLSLSHCTFSRNLASGAGGAVDNYLSTLNITNTILGGNSGNGADIYNWPSSTVNVYGTNLVSGFSNLGTTAGFGATLAALPHLLELGNYGGPTLTMPPQGGSPAINAGSDAAIVGIATDQRGFARVSGTHVDIGAVEAQLATQMPMVRNFSRSVAGTAQFSFTNIIGGSFTVFATTNLALPYNTWSLVGTATESPVGSGQFQFTDPAATGPRLFYRVQSP